MEPDQPIVVIGAGFVGLATATFLADSGHRVTVVEKNPYTLETLRHGELHFREPRLQHQFSKAVREHRITVVSPSPGIYRQTDLIIIAIDSVDPGGWRMRIDTFARLAEWIADSPRRRTCTVVLKSTNVLGFAEEFRCLLDTQSHGDKIRLAVNPEFLREGHAYEDTAEPWRVVIGAEDRSTRSRLKRFYTDIYGETAPVITCDMRSAELIKLASNLYLSHRLAFINEIGLYAHRAGLDIDLIRKAIGLDQRIGRDYFNPGLGFGGSCLPKDCNLINSRELGEKFTFSTAETALQINERVLDDVIDALEDSIGRPLKGKKLALLGAAFKPETDDTRGSQAVALAVKLRRRGATPRVFEPYLQSSSKIVDAKLPLDDSVEETLRGAEAMIIGTPHRQFGRLKPSLAAKLMKGRVVCDRFRLLERSTWQKEGFEFV